MKIIKIAILLIIILNFFTPFIVANFGTWIVVGLSFFRACISGIFHPSVAKLISQWIPNEEKATAISIYNSGIYVVILGLPALNILCSIGLHWSSVHFLSSGLVFTWLLLWLYFITEEPRKSKNMSENEKLYLDSFPELRIANRKVSLF